ncbi:sigma-70 family RNA polymerase sigma factor [Rhodopseudomonas palustris]|uniref:RNA polymerase ECF-type sigma factor n=1 Tax=Rhodopseudomonas palustris (strain ATCC BAA-98 / CGA009) TaxID=258594 RepID=Q6NAR5_RHOPA|nr:sigma-70 family RNA polymerase sigma factor [Rhodopseudomonas palustris]OPF91611.1 RNA polymerase sigma factor SigJ [Rhodopseudomonas palustris]PPQ44483.1 RNA polymerase sigma factor SigJ [Rhodopseudomonas palustris]QQM02611.1 ECF RNA polymerase sigma factor SigJ [Rhodopseudomonas palustris]RJF60230.1 sigma-70 family RNA polymerase sigma factor [Rhodopseudomonas palustris]WAB78790.1 sigma-70 family RNA polymerase sigma factor [Rhodopseudomonas palustris]
MPRPPDPGTPDDAAASFAPLRPRLLRVAYRMLGSISEAEDVVQDAYLRWHRSDRRDVRDPAGFLTRTVTRLCLDVLKSARQRRETYVGPWLPEPIIAPELEPDGDDITLTLMLALERLSPLERAAFLLHDVFGVGFDEIGTTLGRDAAACRQLAARARAHVRAERPRFPVSAEQGQAIAAAFFQASRSGDLAALTSLLANEVVFVSDGGGKRPAAINPVHGSDRVTRLLVGIARKAPPGASSLLAVQLIDGLPGFVSREPDGLIQTTALEMTDGRIVAIYVVRNPDKLRHLIPVQPSAGLH